MHEYVCTTFTFYNPFTTKCESTCRGVTYQVVLRADGPQNDSTGPVQPDNPPQPPELHPPIDQRCKKPNGNFLFDSCFSYVHCEGGLVLYDSICATKTYFSELVGRCVMDDFGVCPLNSDPKPAPEPQAPAVDPRCSSAIENFAAVPNSCTEYYVCHHGQMVTQVACAPDTFFHEQNGACRTDIPISCLQTAADHRCAAQSTGFSALSGSCTKYVYCVAAQVRSELECPSGLFFDESYAGCSVTRPSSCPQIVVAPVERCLRAAGYFREAGSCTRYVYCIKRVVRFEYECTGGEIFSDIEEKCVVGKPTKCD